MRESLTSSSLSFGPGGLCFSKEKKVSFLLPFSQFTSLKLTPLFNDGGPMVLISAAPGHGPGGATWGS